MLEQIYTSTKTITCGSNMDACRMAYVKAWDAMAFHDENIPGKLSKLFRDGSMATMAGFVATSMDLAERVDGRHCWIWSYIYDCNWFAADEISGFYHTDQILNGNWVPPIQSFRPGHFVDDKRHLIIYSYTQSRIHFIDLITGLEIAYITLPGTGLIYDHIAWAGEGKVIAIDFGTGRVSLIDYINRTIIWSSMVRPCKMAAYDCTHNLVITVEADKLVRVYTIDPVPAVLSNPEFIPTSTYQHRLVGSKVRTRLTGDAGEICPDYWIHWSLLGLPSKGELLKDKSKTDADGYAENYYFGPRAVGETGQETIRVSVKVPS